MSMMASATATAQVAADTITCKDVATFATTDKLAATDSTFAATDSAFNSVTKCAEAPAKKKKSFFKRLVAGMYEFVKDFSRVDKDYIEPQAFNYTVMLQNTYTYELYRITSSKGNDFTFAPLPSIKLGPYIGWRWVFFGYTFDLKHISNGDKKKEFDLSLYSSQIGVDLFYRKTGTDYKISRMRLDPDANVDTRPMRGVSYDGIDVSIKGFNLYYIFNHKRFSYPAAFSQSTIQRRSCGSALCGIGYTQHSLSIDWEKLNSLVSNRLDKDVADKYMDTNLRMKKVKYTDIAVSGGYAYNWVFSHNWLAAASLSLALGYKRAWDDSEHERFTLKDFSFHNFNIDGVGRFGVVWNNMRWYYGANCIVHTYNYRKSKFSTNNIFGSLNIYIGVNFGRQK